MENILVQSENYIVVSEFEEVRLIFRNNYPSKIVGDFYGNPKCAIISHDEKYLVVGGCGLIVYNLENPFEEFEYNKITKQYFEFKREQNDIWWISNLNLNEENESFTFILEKNQKKYEMNFKTHEYISL